MRGITGAEVSSKNAGGGGEVWGFRSLAARRAGQAGLAEPLSRGNERNTWLAGPPGWLCGGTG